MRFARKVDGDNYIVQYREIRGDPIERFVTAKVKETRVRVSKRGLPDLTDLLGSHRPHGPLTADATEPAWNGYLLTD